MRELSGGTRLAAVIGSPVRHSLSPIIHNAAFDALDLDWAYLAFDVAPGGAADAVNAMRTLGIEGMSVTMPHKAAVADALDELTDQARALEAVNCIAWRDDRLVGHNTDGQGLVDSLRREVALDVAGTRFGIVGAGGAARAVIAALGDAGAGEVLVVNRSLERAERAAELASGVGRVGSFEDLSQCEVVVNATPIGMAGVAEGEVPFDPELLGPGQLGVDLIYQPLETPLLADLRGRGVTAVNGVGMLVHQAAVAFELWTGAEPPIDAMLAAVAVHLPG